MSYFMALRSSRFFSHKMPKGFPSVQGEVRNINITESDILIAKRILISFNKALTDENAYTRGRKDEDMWDVIKEQAHSDFFKTISSNDPHKIAEYLGNMHRYGITQGITQGADDYRAILSSTKLKRRYITLVKDRIISLAEMLGILPFENPEQGRCGENIYRDTDQIVDEIGKKIGIDIIPPDIDGGMYKLKLKRGYFDSRDILSLYTAWRISKLVTPKSAVSEIGGGLGKVALYSSRLNFLNYSIFDLPQINVIQAWYLIKSGVETSLYGEVEKENSTKILPYWKFPNGQYDLVLNEDSFPEIRKSTVVDYLKKIKGNAKFFFSINQESEASLVSGTDKQQLIVSQTVDKLGGFKRIYRFPFLLRNGYVEELYEIE